MPSKHKEGKPMPKTDDVLKNLLSTPPKPKKMKKKKTNAKSKKIT
jgi:hypothetical protein